jgi:hypothetical protein
MPVRRKFERDETTASGRSGWWRRYGGRMTPTNLRTRKTIISNRVRTSIQPADGVHKRPAAARGRPRTSRWQRGGGPVVGGRTSPVGHVFLFCSRPANILFLLRGRERGIMGRQRSERWGELPMRSKIIIFCFPYATAQYTSGRWGVVE